LLLHNDVVNRRFDWVIFVKNQRGP